MNLFVSLLQVRVVVLWVYQDHFDSLLTFLSLLREYEPSGRLISDFELSKLESDPYKDRVLEDGDVIHIPSFMNEVYVYGES